MLTQNELLYTLALQRVKNLGDASAKKLIRIVGSAEGVFKEKKQALLKIDGIGLLKLKHLSTKQQLPKAEKEIRFINDHNISCHFFLDEKYPSKLKHCADGPLLIFHRGKIDVMHRKLLSIVGTRKITSYGVHFCRKLIADLAPLEPVIISGFAYGVDITAHKMAIECNLQTVACLAHGFNQMYPKTHQKYAEALEKNGGFITEFWSDDPFERTNFLKRNRIIAGLSQATIVIESAEKGGSLVTADIANSYHRDVFAVPGRATDTQSLGCNNLIKSNQAHLLTNAADLVYLLGWKTTQEKKKVVQTKLFAELTNTEMTVVQYLTSNGKQDLDTIALACNLTTHKIAALLLTLELKGVVQPLPGKVFEVI